MMLIIGFMGTILVCGVMLYWLIKNENARQDTSVKRSKFLYCSSNRNSYAKARDVFEVLEDAKICPDFLGGQYEQR